MPEIEIRPANAADITALVGIDHDYVSDHVWQMEIQQDSGPGAADYRIDIHFRQVQLPR